LTRLGQALLTVSQRPKIVLFIGTYVRAFEVIRAQPIPPIIPGRITPSFPTMPGVECPGRLRDAREAFDRSMADAGVTVHVLDAVGVDSEVSTPLGPGRMRERLDSLPVIADLTGGRTVANTSSPEDQIAAILDESGAYYVLGFAPASQDRPERTRRIDVRVRRPGVAVKARKEYRLAEQRTSARHGDGLKRAVSTVLPARDVPLAVSAVPMIAGRRTAAVLVGRLPAGVVRPASMLSAAFTVRGAPVVSRRLEIPAASGGGGSAPLGLISALELGHGSYEIRFAASLPGGEAGSVHTFVDIPDFTKAPLSMSGVLLRVVPEEPAVPRSEIDALPFVPTARRAFQRTETVSVFVQVSQGTARKDPLQPVTLRLRIEDASGTTRRNEGGSLAAAEFATHRTANARLPLPVGDLPPGDYLLTLEAALGAQRAERFLRFAVE
jgi:hypothetical protein